MTRVLALLLLPVFAVAAPAPPPSEKEQIEKLWGKVEGAGEAKLTDNRLALHSTTNQPVCDLSWGERVTMPRVTRTVRGDFEMTVRVADAKPPVQDVRQNLPHTRAGLFLTSGGYSLQLHLHQDHQILNGVLLRPNLVRRVDVCAWYPRGGAGSSFKDVPDGKSTYLRMTRKGRVVLHSYSFDGKEWSEPTDPFQAQKLDFPDEVTVGVFLSHTTDQILDATFDGFVIEQPKAEQPKAEKPK